MKIYKEEKLNEEKRNKNKLIFWIFKISLMTFFLSFMLSFFSEIILKSSNLFMAFLLLIIFLFLNVFSDMLGLAITSCQKSALKDFVKREDVYRKAVYLVNNSDKVSSVLCDVIGDVSGILCGVSGTIIAIGLSVKYNTLSINIFLGTIVSASIAALTVFFKAFAKRYAIEHSTFIVCWTSKKLIKIRKIFSIIFRRKK